MRNLIDLRYAMLPADFAGLQALAVATDSVAERGRSAGDPSWRNMMRRIAQGDLIVVDPANGMAYRADPADVGQVLAGSVWLPVSIKPAAVEADPAER